MILFPEIQHRVNKFIYSEHYYGKPDVWIVYIFAKLLYCLIKNKFITDSDIKYILEEK